MADTSHSETVEKMNRVITPSARCVTCRKVKITHNSTPIYCLGANHRPGVLLTNVSETFWITLRED